MAQKPLPGGSQTLENGIDPAHLSLLLGNIPRSTFPRVAGQRAYGQIPESRPKPKVPAYLSPEQGLAWQYFAEQGAVLKSGYKKNEVKVAFRKIAKKIHPDVFPKPESHELFLRLQLAYKHLYWMGR